MRPLAAICSDSLSNLTKLKQGLPETIQDYMLIKSLAKVSKHYKLTLFFVRGHAGWFGNEEADKR